MIGSTKKRQTVRMKFDASGEGLSQRSQARPCNRRRFRSTINGLRFAATQGDVIQYDAICQSKPCKHTFPVNNFATQTAYFHCCSHCSAVRR